MTSRIVLVDDHPIVRAGLHTLLAADPRIDVVGEAASGEEALVVVDALARAGQGPDLVLMDLQLGTGITGIEATRQLRATHPQVRVMVLTTFDADTDIFGALEAGAVGYVLKDTPTATLVQAVLDAAAGRPALSPEVALRMVGRVAAPDAGLSPREAEILQLLATGAGNRDIARRLFISESTVKGHLVHVYDKLGVDNRTAAARVARERRLIR
ncbi:response regulator [Arsenicicoccus dermatophilus]|uniref:response regulator n=1 Tax=Arsenicicoccus dermatophilus TaxID=1076331 RepID=UPI001F4C6FAB|nr:response regulator transcription factor [Arsenicicoccus dermatophilus]MCH8613924.1 response regulator transcription factor [Arsenicicoccus dermatophilus]